MSETNYDNQPPIFRFLIKHKWRIILPALLMILYANYQDFFTTRQYAQYSADLFIISAKLNKTQLNEKIENLSNKILSDENLENLMIKYDLLATERKQKIEKQILLNILRAAITLNPQTHNLSNGNSISLWLYFKDGNPEQIKLLSDEIIGMYESDSDIQVEKYTPPAPTTTRYDFNWILLVLQIVLSLLLYSTPLILIWEFPNLFYSPKTQETVFQPLKSDWQNELTEAKLRKQPWKAFEINIRYYFAFLSAMLQRSPIGDLIEFVRKIAS